MFLWSQCTESSLLQSTDATQVDVSMQCNATRINAVASGAADSEALTGMPSGNVLKQTLGFQLPPPPCPICQQLLQGKSVPQSIFGNCFGSDFDRPNAQGKHQSTEGVLDENAYKHITVTMPFVYYQFLFDKPTHLEWVNPGLARSTMDNLLKWVKQVCKG